MATKKNINITNNTDVTSINDLVKYQEGMIVDLPPFGPDMPFRAKLKRPSILALAKAGKIPNSLMQAADSLFSGSKPAQPKKMDRNNLADTYEVFEILCEATFVSPTWHEIKEAGIELTDEQLVFLFNYTQRGIKSLSSFRQEQSNN